MKKIIVICLILIALPVLGQKADSPDSGNADSGSNQESSKYQQTVDISSVVGPLQTLEENSKTDKEAEKRKEQREIDAINIANQDLFEQKKMAKFTRLIYIVTAVGVIFSLLGLAALIWTLRLQRQTMLQNRAWVALKEAGEGFTYPESDSLNILIKNFGKLPATNTTIKWGMFGLGGDHDIDEISKDAIVEWTVDKIGIIAPSVEISVQLTFIKKDRELLEVKGNRMICFFDIDYIAGYGITGKTFQTVAIKKNFIDGRPADGYIVTPTHNNRDIAA